MSTILLPTDHSEHSRKAIEYAFSLFRDSDHRFLIMNAYFMPHAGAVMMTSIEDVLKKSATEDMDALMKDLKDDFPHLADRLDHLVEYGDPYVAVQSTLKEKPEIELIVMGTTGATGLKEILIGSVTAQIVKNAPCAVLAVPSNAGYSKPERIAFASDNSEFQKADLRALLAIAKLHDSNVHVFNVAPEDGRNTEEVIKGGVTALEGIEHDVRAAKDDDVEAGILNFVNEHSCDMLAMVHHRYGTIEQLFHKSASKQLALHTHVPLLVLQEKRN